MTGPFVIVGGAPATGKTALAQALAAALALPVITKDDVKEALAEPFATGDRDWSRQLGSAAYAVLYMVAERILAAGNGLILESNFRRDSEAQLKALAGRTPTAVVVCRTSDEVRRQRFEQRAARGRHRVHVDTAILDEWHADDAEFVIDIGTPRLIVDTTDGYAPGIDAILAFTRTATVVRR